MNNPIAPSPPEVALPASVALPWYRRSKFQAWLTIFVLLLGILPAIPFLLILWRRRVERPRLTKKPHKNGAKLLSAWAQTGRITKVQRLNIKPEILAIALAFLVIVTGPAKARYEEADPLNRLAGPNVYAYADGNPLKNIDPSGLDTIIITGGWPDHSNNIFGHSAMAFTGAGLYSYGNSEAYGASVTDYLNQQLQQRNLTITTLSTDPAQEALMAANYWANFQGPDSHYSAVSHNCSDATLGAMRAGGLLTGYPSPTLPYDSENAAQSIPGATTIFLPKGSQVPAFLNPYNWTQ